MQRRQFISLIGGAALGLGGCSATKAVEAAEAALTRFRDLMREHKYAGIYQETSDELKKTPTEQQFTTLLAAIERKLGAVKDSKNNGWHVHCNSLSTTVALTRTTEFEQGSGEERFVLRISGGEALLTGSHSSSQGMMVN